MLRIVRRPHHSPASSDSESIDQELARGLPHRSERSRDPVRPSGYCFLGSPLFQRRTRRLLVYSRAPNSSSMRVVSTKTAGCTARHIGGEIPRPMAECPRAASTKAELQWESRVTGRTDPLERDLLALPTRGPCSWPR